MSARAVGTTEEAVLPSHRLATTLGALVVPLVVLGTAVAIVLSWRDQLPDPVASSWGSGNTVTGTSSLTGVLVAMAAPVAAVSIVTWLVGMFAGRTASLRRVLAGFASGLAVFVCGLIVASLEGQRGLASAYAAPGIGASVAIVAVAALVVGAVVAALMPGDTRLPATGRVPSEAPRARLAGTAGASWSGFVTLQHGLVWAAVGLVFVVGIGVLAQSVWLALIPAVILAGVAVSMARWAVTIDERGLVASTVLSLFRVTIPLDEVEWAEVTQVNPVKDFGGWGYRLGRSGRAGILLRSGEALVVHRSGGRQLVITVDNAQRGAALLNTLVERNRR
jgi:hypothetical protein